MPINGETPTQLLRNVSLREFHAWSGDRASRAFGCNAPISFREPVQHSQHRQLKEASLTPHTQDVECCCGSGLTFSGFDTRESKPYKGRHIRAKL